MNDQIWDLFTKPPGRPEFDKLKKSIVGTDTCTIL